MGNATSAASAAAVRYSNDDTNLVHINLARILLQGLSVPTSISLGCTITLQSWDDSCRKRNRNEREGIGTQFFETRENVGTKVPRGENKSI
jgi:hypothetical protein